MKKWLFVFLSAIIFNVPISFADYDEDTWALPSDKTDTKVVPIQKCPTTFMTEKCLDCHTLKKVDGNVKFVVKDITIDSFYTYPNEFTKMREIDGEIWGVYNCTDIDADKWSEAVDFFKLHDVNNILFEIHSPGGEMYAMLKMIGIMKKLESEGVTIHTRAYGEAASAGFILFLYGSIGHRLVHDNALFMIHQISIKTGSGWGFVSYTTPAAQEDKSEILKFMQKTIERCIIERSNGKLDINTLIEKTYKKEWWLRGDDMIKIGLADGYIHKVD